MDFEALMAMTVNELRALAEDRDVSWHDSDGKPLRKADLVESIAQSFPIEDDQEQRSSSQDETAEVELPRVPSAAPVPVSDEVAKEESAVPDVNAWYVVDEDSKYAADGIAHHLKKGSVVSALTHPLELLKAQNVPMTFMLSSEVREQAHRAKTIFVDVYAEPAVQPTGYVPEPIAPAMSPESAQLVELLPDGTREPVPAQVTAPIPDVEAKVER